MNCDAQIPPLDDATKMKYLGPQLASKQLFGVKVSTVDRSIDDLNYYDPDDAPAQAEEEQVEEAARPTRPTTRCATPRRARVRDARSRDRTRPRRSARSAPAARPRGRAAAPDRARTGAARSGEPAPAPARGAPRRRLPRRRRPGAPPASARRRAAPPAPPQAPERRRLQSRNAAAAAPKSVCSDQRDESGCHPSRRRRRGEHPGPGRFTGVPQQTGGHHGAHRLAVPDAELCEVCQDFRRTHAFVPVVTNALPELRGRYRTP